MSGVPLDFNDHRSTHRDARKRVRTNGSAPAEDVPQDKSAASDPFLRTDEGNLKPLLANALAAFRSAPEWKGVLAYDEFSLNIVSQRPAPWQKSRDVGQNWGEYEATLSTEWLQRYGISITTPTTEEAIRAVAKENKFHPIKDYLNGLAWDGSPRLDTWLTKYLGAADSPFIRAVGPAWLISGCARIFEPGCQADYCLLLQGKQGSKKSSALRILARKDAYFTDHVSDIGSKDSKIELRKWIIELSELAPMRRGENEKHKNFLTCRVDKFRPPYGRLTESFERICIFAASVNDDTPFTDPTGSRRYWPVSTEAIDLQELERDCDQLWAEAHARYRKGEIWWLSDELNKLAAQEQEERYAPGLWDDEILPWLESPVQRQERDGAHGELLPVHPFDSAPGQVTVGDVLVHCIGKPTGHRNQSDWNSVARFLQHIGWKRQQLRVGAVRKWFYVRPE